MASVDRDSVLATVCRHLAEILEIDAATISDSQKFADDLGADSIALIELVDSLEQEYAGLEFNDDELGDLKTVGNAVDYIIRVHG
jgi:acyl carrier protein